MTQAFSLRIGKVIRDLENNRYLLPAIQREFVWPREKICGLFDSLMRGYPIGTFLFWKIRPEQREKYRFYAFMRSYHERDNNRCHLPDVIPLEGFDAVLDGQQRMTALYIGLRGTYAAKKPHGRWNNDDAFPETRLHLNLLHAPEAVRNADNSDESRLYAFEFKTDEEAERGKTRGEWWFRCSRVCDAAWNIDNYLDDEFENEFDEIENGETAPAELRLLRNSARKILRKLDTAINRADELTYFSEETESLDRVLNIFIRLNSGGVPLSYSDLLLSIAIAQWDNTDAREEINALRAALFERYNFDLSKDFILKAALMLSDIGSIKFSVENFTRSNSEKLEASWPDCKRYLSLAVALLHDFGYTTQNLAAANAILPVAYYLKSREATDAYLTSATCAEDRHLLLRWFNLSILKQGTWGSGVDTFLSQLRETIRNAVSGEQGTKRFPYEEIEKTMLRSGRSLQFTSQEIDELLDLQKGKGRTFTLLNILFPRKGLRRDVEHVDHIYPHALFGRKKVLAQAGYTDEQIREAEWKHNLLPNLQLLPGHINLEKSDMMPLAWLNTLPEGDRAAHIREELLEGVTDNPEDFFAFFEARREKLRLRIAMKLDIPLETDAK